MKAPSVKPVRCAIYTRVSTEHGLDHAPNLVKAAVEGRLPRGIGVERLRDPPTEWSRQFEALGLNPE
jgi:hypothetical protein